MATILVTDGEQRAALSVARSLGAAGHWVLIAAARDGSIAGSSRYASAEFIAPDPLIDPEAFADRIAAVCRSESVELLLPITDASLLAVQDRPKRFAEITIPWPEADTVRRVANKAVVLDLAREIGLATPQQCEIGSERELKNVLDRVTLPVVVKPTRSLGEADAERHKFVVAHAADPDRLRKAVQKYPRAAFPLLLQQRIVGPGIGIFLLSWNGRLIARFAHRRIREKPPSGGVSVYCESIAMPQDLEAGSRQLLDGLGWSGVAMVEFKLDQASGRPYLMEINGRFWGSLQLAVDSGVDFPRLLVAAARGENPAPVLDYRTGVRSRWWWGDVDHLLARVRKSNAELALPPGSAGRLKAMLDFLVLWRPGDHNEVLRWNDPRPFLVETRNWLRGR
jgi:predicted ATP-grasp superfamily ATP-dependent carboligase